MKKLVLLASIFVVSNSHAKKGDVKHQTAANEIESSEGNASSANQRRRLKSFSQSLINFKKGSKKTDQASEISEEPKIIEEKPKKKLLQRAFTFHFHKKKSKHTSQNHQ